MLVMNETLLKAKILTHGIHFTHNALNEAKLHNAKFQNLVYNIPQGADNFRPQELLITHEDGYKTVVSCVAPHKTQPIIIDCIKHKLIANVHGKILKDISIDFVQQPQYYTYNLKSGKNIKNYISSCGLDELNIIPWKGCAISKACLFCGSNNVALKNPYNSLTAVNISKSQYWEKNKNDYLNNLREAIYLAKNDSCFEEHMHVIIISGNVRNEQLDQQAIIYSEIANAINTLIANKTTEGIVAVLMPPNNLGYIHTMYTSGIKNFVFNFEVSNHDLFQKYCPGKSEIGYNHIMNALEKAVSVSGRNNSWTNFVLGLEPIDNLLKFNELLAKKGIVSSANVLHLDTGNRLDCELPSYEEVIHYFYSLSEIYKINKQNPFYCSKALRTSLTNEAFERRIRL